MAPIVVIAVFTFALLIFWLAAPRGVPWAHTLTRLHPGSGRRGEWMAPPDVVRAVKREYLATQTWLAECAADWGLLAAELDHHAAGAYYKRQHAALALLVQAPGPRLAANLAADHLLAVRHFSSDGLRCLLIDRQSQRLLNTRGYWSGRLVHRQRLPDVDFVFQMLYYPPDRRWKIERLVQRLPRPDNAGVPVSVAAELPIAAGRDY